MEISEIPLGTRLSLKSDCWGDFPHVDGEVVDWFVVQKAYGRVMLSTDSADDEGTAELTRNPDYFPRFMHPGKLALVGLFWSCSAEVELADNIFLLDLMMKQEESRI